MAWEAVYIRIILKEMWLKQPPTPIQTDNAMANVVINGKITPKQTKAMEMRFHWLRDHECQKQFKFFWRPGKTNYADYWTKHHTASHIVNVCKEFLTPFIVLKMLRINKVTTQAAWTCKYTKTQHTNSTWRGCDDITTYSTISYDGQTVSQAPLVSSHSSDMHKTMYKLSIK